MGSFNRVILIGNLGRDAELKYTPGGAAVTTFSVATTEAWKDKGTGAKQERTEWSRVVLWGKAAEAITEYLKKGKQVAVEGKLQTREYEKDGAKRWTTEIKADRVVLLGGGSGNGERRQADTEPESEPHTEQANAPDTDDDVPF
jgi:single-strand DNA-binding protein